MWGETYFEVRRPTFRGSRFAYLAAVLLSDDATEIERAWLVPMRQLPKVARVTEAKFVLRPSKAATSRDRFSPYRCDDARELAERLIDSFNEP